MTAQRRQQRPDVRFARLSAAYFRLRVRAGRVGSAGVDAATTERIVTDRHTGLAISGFDPVAYFTDAVPRKGRRGITNSRPSA